MSDAASSDGPSAPDLDAVAGRFEAFARNEARGLSPLYDALSLHVAETPALLRLACMCRAGQEQPNLLLAAVHHLVRRQPSAPLARYYADVVDAPTPPDGDLAGVFEAFCEANHDAIVDLVSTRLVQTNEPRRSTALLLALDELRRHYAPRSLALIEVGASAGLNLLFPRYRFDLGGGRVVHPEGWPGIACDVRGGEPGRLPQPPHIAWSAGIDLNPIRAEDEESAAWLRSLVWPEERERWALLDAAIAAAAEHPPRIEAGDAFDVLPRLVAEVPADQPVCVFHSATLAHFTTDQRTRFVELLRSIAATRRLYWVSMENPRVTGLFTPPAGAPTRGYFVLGLADLSDADASPVALAAVDPHARWIEWWAEEPPTGG